MDPAVVVDIFPSPCRADSGAPIVEQGVGPMDSLPNPEREANSTPSPDLPYIPGVVMGPLRHRAQGSPWMLPRYSRQRTVMVWFSSILYWTRKAPSCASGCPSGARDGTDAVREEGPSPVIAAITGKRAPEPKRYGVGLPGLEPGNSSL